MTEDNHHDAQLIEHTLETVAARHEDISPLVYAQFFSTCPQAAPLFKVVDPTQPPHGCGQMLFEILSLLQDCASEKTYVAGYMKQIASDHKSFGVHATDFYGQFLESIVRVLRDVMDTHWSAELEAAWNRQAHRLIQFIH
jgi:hemoglobin-like flavoprotein